MAFIIHVNTIRSLPVCSHPAQTSCSEHIWYTDWIKEKSVPDIRPSPSPIHMHTSQHVSQNLVGNLHWQRSAKALPVFLIIPGMLCDIYTQVRSPPKRKHNNETEIWKPRSQWRVSPLIYCSFSQLIIFFLTLCWCTFRLEDPHLQMCVPLLSLFSFSHFKPLYSRW